MLRPCIAFLGLLASCAPVEKTFWEGASLRLPSAEHAVSIAVEEFYRVDHKSPLLTNGLLKEHCVEIKRGKLPKPLTQPAVLSVSTKEVAWMGRHVMPLKNGRYFEEGVFNPIQASLVELMDVHLEAYQTIRERCNQTYGVPVNLEFSGGPVLLAVDETVPHETVRTILSTIEPGMWGNNVMILVKDPSPIERRVQDTRGGASGYGGLMVSEHKVGWFKAQPTESPFNYSATYDSRVLNPPKWYEGQEIPTFMGETTPPSVEIGLEAGSPFGRFVEAQDQLAKAGVFCVYGQNSALVSVPTVKQIMEPAKIPSNPTPVFASPKDSPPPLRLTEGERIAVHVLTPPHIGPPCQNSKTCKTTEIATTLCAVQTILSPQDVINGNP